jgi:hypothetical protein
MASLRQYGDWFVFLAKGNNFSPSLPRLTLIKQTDGRIFCLNKHEK